MAIRGETTGTDEILRDARFHAAALEADPRASALADGVRKPAAALKERRLAANDREDARTEALARLLRMDFELDDRLRLLDLDALGEVRKDRSDPRYRAIFPKGLSMLLALRGEEASREVRAAVERMREKEPALAEVHAAELERLAGGSAQAETAWRQAETDASAAFGQELLARTELVRQLQKNEGALLALFPGQKRRVRSFFRPTRRRGSASDEGAPETTGETS